MDKIKIARYVCLSVYCIILFTSLQFFYSCKLFDKDIRQDKHIAAFKHQLSRVSDSLDTPAERIKALKTILLDIDADDDLITLRKKNKLLIEAHYYLSNEYFKIKNYTKALEYTNLAINLDTTDASGYYNRGSLYQAIGKDSMAVIDYSQAIHLNENYADAYYNRGIIYETTGQYEKALNDYNRAIKEHPKNLADIYNNRGNIYLSLKDTNRALGDYSRVLDIDTANVNAYTNRVGLYIKLNELDKALEDCNKGLAIDSNYVRLYLQRATVFEQQKEYSEAIDDYEKVLELYKHQSSGMNEKIHDNIKRLKSLEKRSK